MFRGGMRSGGNAWSTTFSREARKTQSVAVERLDRADRSRPLAVDLSEHPHTALTLEGNHPRRRLPSRAHVAEQGDQVIR
jgi:hypothetical protein